jgi:hypothetical protein
VANELNRDDEDEFEALDRRVAERRQTMYSVAALQRAAEVDQAMVLHPSFNDGLAALDRVFQLGKALSIPTGLRLIGPPGSGKTSLLRYYIDSQPKSALFARGMGALHIRIRRRPTLGHTVESVLRALKYPLLKVGGAYVEAKRNVSLEALQQKNTHVVLVDEAHNLCTRTSGSYSNGDEGNAITEYLREVMDLRIGLVLAGGVGLAQLGERDKYLHSRCASQVVFVNFSLDSAWAGVVHGLANRSLAHSMEFLKGNQQIVLLHRATRGNLRALKMLVVEAILVATDRDRRNLTAEDMRDAFNRALNAEDGVNNPWAC